MYTTYTIYIYLSVYIVRTYIEQVEPKQIWGALKANANKELSLMKFAVAVLFAE